MLGRELATLFTQPKDMPPTPGDPVSAATKGVFIWEILPPILVKLVCKIRAEEFIEMDELLPDIVRVNREYAGRTWINYDTLYRKHAALKKDTKWSVISTTTYARCVMRAPRNSV